MILESDFFLPNVSHSNMLRYYCLLAMCYQSFCLLKYLELSKLCYSVTENHDSFLDIFLQHVYVVSLIQRALGRIGHIRLILALNCCMEAVCRSTLLLHKWSHQMTCVLKSLHCAYNTFPQNIPGFLLWKCTSLFSCQCFMYISTKKYCERSFIRPRDRTKKMSATGITISISTATFS